MKTCNNCGAALTPGDVFCHKCGAKAEPLKPVCPNCQTEASLGALFCDKCGTKLGGGAAAKNVGGKPRGVFADTDVEEEHDGTIPFNFPERGDYEAKPRPPVIVPRKDPVGQSERQEAPLEVAGVKGGGSEKKFWIFEPLKKYAVFSGRARRRELWWFWLFQAVVVAALSVLRVYTNSGEIDTVDLIRICFVAALFIPNLAVICRRFHDVESPLNSFAALFIVGMMFIHVESVVTWQTSYLIEHWSDNWGGGWINKLIGERDLTLISIFIKDVIIISIIFWLCQDSARGTNKYGPSPKYGNGAEGNQG